MTRRFQFSLRALLVGLIPLCLWLAVESQSARTQAEVVSLVLAKGGWVQYRHQENQPRWDGRADLEPSVPSWLRGCLGDDYFRTATEVYLESDQFGDDDMEIIAQLTTLRRAVISKRASVTRSAMRAFKSRLPQCEIEIYADGDP